MSHMAKVKVQIKDLEVFKKCCKELGMEFMHGQKTYRWFGRFVGDSPLPEGLVKEDLGKCDHAARVKGDASAYEVGLVKQKDGSYVMAYDFWGSDGRALEAKAGKNCINLVKMYSQEVAKKSLIKSGYMFTGKKTLQDGTIELTFSK